MVRSRACPWIAALPVVLAAAMYARFFGGFWLGDDFGNLHRAWSDAQRGALWSQTWAQFFAAVPSEGAFYRPVMIASLSLSEWLAGSRFAGWFAFNYAVHLANTALVALLVARLARACGRDGCIAGAVAAAFFALCPLLAEGVFWISARADASVTLLTLAGVYAWAGSPASPLRAFALPLLLVPALGFKESAAVLPLQMALVALAWPARLSRAQVAAIGGCFALVLLFFAIRAQLFGNVWHVYPAADNGSLLDRLGYGAESIVPWWRALTRHDAGLPAAYVALSAAALTCLGFSARGGGRRLAAALLVASAGLAVATLLNLGGMMGTGEGGRLAYSPIAWLALALGVAGARLAPASDRERHEPLYRHAGTALLACAAIAGAWVLEDELRAAFSAQRDMRALAEALPDWSAAHAGLTLLLVPERDGAVVTARNGQGGLVMPPVQREPLLHRVLPTLPREIESRHENFAGGLATRIDRIRPSHVDAETLAQLFVPDAPRWPDHYACWSPAERRMVEFSAPDPADRARWIGALRQASARCGLE